MDYLKIKGYISQIQSFCVNDGEGLRTNIFLSGCPLRCKWCANPETWTLKNKIEEYKNKLMSVEEVLDHSKKDMIFYRESEGGVTFSGGEPTFQKDFLNALVKAHSKIGVSTAIETSGYFKWDELKDTFERLDLIFMDIKHMESEKHYELTGVHNKIILENIKNIGKLDKDVVIRIPLIKGINDSKENIISTAKFVKQNVPKGKIEILPYHNWGLYKYDVLGLSECKNAFETPSIQEVQDIKTIIYNYGVQIIDYK